MSVTLVSIQGAQLAVDDWGFGEPIVFIQTALTADELRPLARDPALAHGYRKIVYYRRGYAGSSAVPGPGSIARDAADCRALLAAMAIDRAHIVGVSYSAAVGLQLAADAQECAHTLSLLEPPPVHTPSAAAFRTAINGLVRTRRSRGPIAALNEFLTMLIGPNWQVIVEEQLPGSSAQMERDAVSFFDTDLPALLNWQFGPADAGRVRCPVLYIGGTDSGSWFSEVRDLILAWFSHADKIAIDGADHSLAITHAPQIADALASFLRRYPITSPSV